MFVAILVFILILALGGVIGGYIVSLLMDKELDELIQNSHRIIDIQRQVIIADNNIIQSQKSIIGDTYNYLVNLRDNDEGTLDEIIGCLGEVLDDHADEEDETDATSTDE